ncbi:MAG: tryptophan 2,3-dioxygenase family protein [Burkholderiaceae bacterium]
MSEQPRKLTYSDYLSLDTLLTSQHPRSPDHNEMLFIIQHQTSELWMKLMLHELRAAITHLHDDALPDTFKMLARITRIMEQLVSAWTVLSTMTPTEYSIVRPYLGSSSGFQSPQYREIEFRLGNKNAARIEQHVEPMRVHLTGVLHAPSIYDEAIGLLQRSGFDVEPACADPTIPRPFDEKVEAAWLTVYRNPQDHWRLYELAEELIDLEDAFRQWRFRHVTTVERIIGFKPGTGGTGGVSYLRKMLDVVLFPELWKVRTDL